MIDIRVTRTGINRRGMLWSVTATYENRSFAITSSLQPERDILRAVIDATPDFVDSPWRLLRDGEIALSGTSARWRAMRTIEEAEKGTLIRLDHVDLAAFYAPSAPATGGDGREERKGANSGLAVPVA